MKTSAIVFMLVVMPIPGIVVSDSFQEQSDESMANDWIDGDEQGESAQSEFMGFSRIGENHYEAVPTESDSPRAPIRIRIRGGEDSSH